VEPYVPPRWVRRLVLVPLLLVLTLLALIAVPFVVVVGGLLSPVVPMAGRVVRVALFGLAYLLVDSAAVLAAFVLWVASGFGLRLRSPGFQTAHYALMRWVLASLMNAARSLFGLRVEVEPEPRQAPDLSRPLIVLSRHAGPGDSFVLVSGLLSTYRLRPSVVMKAALQLDPSLDVLGNRLPNTFIAPRKGADTRILEEIAALGAALQPGGALLIFPEGANFTPNRRLRSIGYLEKLKMLRQAEEARALEHVMAPRPGGVWAATSAAPGADVVFVAHTGLRDVGELADAWRSLPIQQPIKARWWRVPAEEVPRDKDEQERWLYRWWGKLDQWIDLQQPTPESKV
jgi:1-acyl-sn-glycerol-3-phosphate acyltransferase